MGIVAVPIRTVPFDAKGNWVRQWILFFESLGATPDSDGSIISLGSVGGVFTPDLDLGSKFRILLTADATLAAAANADGKKWELIVDQDSTGNWNLVADPSYVFNANLLGTAAPSTRSRSSWATDTGSSTLTTVPVTDQPIP